MGSRYRKRRRSRYDDPTSDALVAVVGTIFLLAFRGLRGLWRWTFGNRPSPTTADRVEHPTPSRNAASPRPADERLPYERTSCLLTKGERALWFPLFYAVRRRYRIFPKVRLADVVACPRSHPQSRSYWGKIKGYHLDFVLCDPETTRPLLAIELDDATHRTGVRQRERDAFKDAVLASAGVPILRIPAQPAYAPTELQAAIDALLAPHPDATA